MTDHDKPEGEPILERNLSELLTRAHEPPRLADEARARILTALGAMYDAKSAQRAA